MKQVSCQYSDVIIVGAGIMGLALAHEYKNQHPGASILLLEKEPNVGGHGSGRNSGVLHSGIYYPETSIKAKVCAKGAKTMAAFCEENGLPLKRMGKIILPIREQDDCQIDLLLKRALNNGANVNLIDSKQISEIEPDAYSVTGRALHSPDTAVVDPNAVLEKLVKNLKSNGVEFHFNSKFHNVAPDKNEVQTTLGKRYRYGKLFNAAGQFADRIALMFGVGSQYTILPFKGYYYKMDPKSGIHINGLIYPVPDLNVPFLGVHSVKKITGEVYFGPTAVPAFGREHYHGMKGINLEDAISISHHLAQQFIRNKQGFRQFALEEAGRFLRSRFAQAVKAMIPNFKTEYLLPSGKIGIRAQLLNKLRHELIMDFLVEKKENTIHILNAVSPGFTGSFEFAKRIIREDAQIVTSSQ